MNSKITKIPSRVKKKSIVSGRSIYIFFIYSWIIKCTLGSEKFNALESGVLESFGSSFLLIIGLHGVVS
jgi:hypothetical protein